jgi:hypothetical protein
MSLSVTSSKPTLRILDGGAGARWRDDETTRPFVVRLRPDEQPAWISLDLCAHDVAQLRARAGAAGLAVDALVSLALEWMLLVRDVPGLAGQSQQGAAEARTCRRLAPTPALRGWIQQLDGHDEQPADTLPEVVMPARLLARWRPNAAEAVAAVASLPLATVLQLERTAACAGLTLTEWSYRSALLRTG